MIQRREQQIKHLTVNQRGIGSNPITSVFNLFISCPIVAIGKTAEFDSVLSGSTPDGAIIIEYFDHIELLL